MTARLAALAILDLALLALAAGGPMPVGVAMAGHASLAAAALWLWLRAGRRPTILPAVAGMAGPLALLVAAAVVRPARPAPPIDDDEAPEVEATAASSALRMLDGRVHHAAPDALGSLVTVLRYGGVHDRRRALEGVVRSFRPALSPLLAIALTDRDQTIRALAAAAAARVGQNLATARAGADASAEDDRVPLAALLADHARGNVLLSDSQRDHLRDDALALLGESAAAAGLRRQIGIEARWAAGDYAACDDLVADTRPADASGTAAAIDWWRRA